MSAFPSSATSPLISKSEYYSSLSWFRRWLAMLNWRPVVDYELREIEHEQRMKQLKSEILLIESENARLAKLNAKLSAISSSSATNSSPANPKPSESGM
jgi:hypothetical protein